MADHKHAKEPFVWRRCPVALLTVLLLPTSIAAASDPMVTITGGADPTGHHYTWTLTNHHTSRVVFVEFPHYHVGMFFAPDGWSTDESTSILSVQATLKPGVCVARAQSPEDGTPPGASTVFRAQLGPYGAPRGPGVVRVQFADGTETLVRGVELPQAPSTGERFVPLIGLGSIFIVWLIVRKTRRKTRPNVSPRDT